MNLLKKRCETNVLPIEAAAFGTVVLDNYQNRRDAIVTEEIIPQVCVCTSHYRGLQTSEHGNI